MKIVTIIGARPQFIKAARVSRAIQDFNQAFRGSRSKNRIREILVHTGQHYDYLMDKVFFEELDLPKPDHHLGVGSGSHGKQTGMMLERIEPILQMEKPDVVLVYGDTNSTLAGALAAAKMNIPVAHVEAGLRSYDRTHAGGDQSPSHRSSFHLLVLPNGRGCSESYQKRGSGMERGDRG